MTPTLFDAVEKSARFSADRVYRYELVRRWDEGNLLNFLMLNPSTADEYQNDPTVERCERRARMWGFGGLVVTNLFAFRATDPDVMKAAADPIGPENDEIIAENAARAAMVICAWGKDGLHLDRAMQVYRLLMKHDLYTLKLSQVTGMPYHPLYLSYSLKPVVFREREVWAR